MTLRRSRLSCARRSTTDREGPIRGRSSVSTGVPWRATSRISSTRLSSVPRVGLDGRDLLRKRTGVVNNTVNLARVLTADHRPDVIVYVDRPASSAEQPPPGVPLREVTAPPVLWKHVGLPLALARDHVDVFHSPTGTLPLVTACKQVVTIHDLFAAIE